MAIHRHLSPKMEVRTMKIYDQKILVASVVFAMVAFSCLTMKAQEPIQHSLFIAGPVFTGILNEDGSVQWTSDRKAARDGFVLDNGNVLIAWNDEVKEISPSDKNAVVFHYRKSATNKEIGTVQRLPNGNTLITELGSDPRLFEVTSKGDVVVSVKLDPETDNAHMQTRMARKLASGNYLVPHLLAFKVKEYDSTGKVVQTIVTDLDELGGRKAENWPFTAIRLDNGNTLVNLTHGNKTVEFDPTGKVVWQVSNDDFPDLKPFSDPCGAQHLPNGNTVIASYQAKEGIKIFEVTRDKKIVWTYQGPYRAHELQVLTTNGVKIASPPLK
jgi:hypothetical protein